MELFLFGVLTTLTLIAIIRQYNKANYLKKDKKALVRQSSMFLLIKNFLPDLMFDSRHRYSQAIIYEQDKTFDYIEMPDKKAYWLDKNKIYYAEVIDGKFDPGNKKLTEMKNLSEEEVSKLLYIYNSLKSGF
jgi:hypothetical protein